MSKPMYRIIGLGLSVAVAITAVGVAAAKQKRPGPRKSRQAVTTRVAPQAISKADRMPAEWHAASARHLAKLRQELVDHRSGTHMSLARAVADADKPLQDAICAQFALQDFRPPDRDAHFAWVSQVAANQGVPEIRVTGWYGQIQETQGDASGAIVKVLVAPYLSGPFGIGSGQEHITHDAYVEYYRYAGGILTYLRGEPYPDGKQWLFGG